MARVIETPASLIIDCLVGEVLIQDQALSVGGAGCGVNNTGRKLGFDDTRFGYNHPAVFPSVLVGPAMSRQPPSQVFVILLFFWKVAS